MPLCWFGNRPAAAQAPASAQHLRGILLERETRAPIAGAHLEFFEANETAATTTDGAGRFQLELEPGWTLGASVQGRATRGETPQLVFEGPVTLAPDLVLLGRSRCPLRGRLVVDQSAGFGQDAPLRVSASVARDQDGVGSFLGTALLDRDLRFEFEAWFENRPEEVRLTFASGSSQFFAADVPMASLLVPTGAAIRLPLVKLSVHVVDEKGLPLAGAEVRVKPLPLELRTAILTGSSTDGGLVRFHVPPGEAELAVGLPGRAVHTEVLALPPGPERAAQVPLRRLGTEDVLEGVVVDADGLAVSGAEVVAGPCTLEPGLSGVAPNLARTDSEGHFSLAIGADAEMTVSASRADLGGSSALRVDGGERDLRLVIPPQGRLRLQLEGLAPGVGTSDGFDWLLVDAEGRPVDSGHGTRRLLELERVPAGRFEVFAHVLGTGTLGSAALLVEPTRECLATLTLAPVASVHGRLIDSEGRPVAGLELRLEGAALPAAAGSHFDRTRSDGLGGFELLLGGAQEAVLVLPREHGEPVRRPVVPGDLGLVRLPK